MGITICSKHGRSGFYETCEHAYAQFQTGVYKEFRPVTGWLDTLVCDDCWDKYDIARYENHPEISGKEFEDIDEENQIVKEYLEIYSNMKRSCWCEKCLTELRDKK